MRHFLVVASVLAAIAAPVAGATNGRSLSIHASSARVLYGGRVTLSGRLSNGLAHQAIAVFATRVGHGMARIGTARTTATGTWSIRVEPAAGTSYSVRLGPTVSPTIAVAVAPRLTTRELGDGVIVARVAAGTSLRGQTLDLQRASGPNWSTVATGAIGSDSLARFAAPITRGSVLVRVALGANAAGTGSAASQSHAFVYRAAYVTLAPSTARARYGIGLVLSGRISAGVSGQVVTIVAHRYGSATATSFTATTRADGRWSRHVEPTIETAYQGHWNGLATSAVVVGVEPALSVSRLASGLVSVGVRPSGVFVGRNVELQRRISGAWHTIAVVALSGPLGRATFPNPPAAGEALRVAMSVNEAGKGYLGAHTGLLVFQAHAVSLVPSGYKVMYGHSLGLSGAVSNGAAGERVEILGWPYGASAPHVIATVTTRHGGRWSIRVTPSMRTSYTARWGTTTSPSRVIGVQPLVAVTLLSHNRVRAHVTAPKALRGRLVELQQLTAAGWKTVKFVHLGAGANAVFAAPVSGTRLRVALSVNEAGAGLLGAHSSPFIVHV